MNKKLHNTIEVQSVEKDIYDFTVGVASVSSRGSGSQPAVTYGRLTNRASCCDETDVSAAEKVVTPPRSKAKSHTVSEMQGRTETRDRDEVQGKRDSGRVLT